MQRMVSFLVHIVADVHAILIFELYRLTIYILYNGEPVAAVPQTLPPPGPLGAAAA